VEESIRMTEDRDKWRKYVHGVANPWIEDGLGTEHIGYLYANIIHGSLGPPQYAMQGHLD